MEMLDRYNSLAIINDMQEFFSYPTDISEHFTQSEWHYDAHKLGVKRIAHILKSGSSLPEVNEVFLEYPGCCRLDKRGVA